MKETISIFGLGYVGTVTAACLAEAGYSIVGVDTQAVKVDAIKSGRSPVAEPEVDRLLDYATSKGRLSATADAREAVLSSDISIVCVGTPSRRNGMLDLQYVENVVKQIREALGRKNGSHILVLRSTMLPGSTRQLVESFLGGFIEDEKLSVFFVPEFLREGTAVSDFRDPSLAVIGTKDGTPADCKAVQQLFSQARPHIVCWEEAEAVKYACNAFHALKVSFANEIGRLGKALGIDARTVMDIVCDDTRLNISPYYLKPGTPYGGSCLPKDLAALNSLAFRDGVFLPVLQSIEDSNRRHQDLLLSIVTSYGARNVCLLGLTFKPQTDDLRNSPMVFLAEALLGKGHRVSIIDEQLRLDSVIGSNRAMLEAALPHLGSQLRDDFGAAISEADLLVVSQPCVSLEVIKKNLRPDHVIVDIVGLEELEALPCRYEGLCWERGNLE